MVDFAEAATECGHLAAAASLFDQLAPWADQLPATGASALGPVSHYLGGLAAVLGRPDQSDAYFARATALNDRMQAKFFAARTDLSWGRVLGRASGTRVTPRRPGSCSVGHRPRLANGYGGVERRAARPCRIWPDGSPPSPSGGRALV